MRSKSSEKRTVAWLRTAALVDSRVHFGDKGERGRRGRLLAFGCRSLGRYSLC